MNYNHLHYFHVAATEGTVAGAAERLGVKQPTVSEQIKALERTLEVSLFLRTPGGLRLTAAGRVVFEHTSVLFQASERLVDSLRAPGEAAPRTRVGISTAVARTTANNFVMPLLASDHGVPSIRTGDSVELFRAVCANQLDLVIAETEPSAEQRKLLAVTLVERVRLVAIASPDARPAPDWRNLALVRYRASSSYRWAIDAYLDTAGLRPRIAAEADDAMYMLEAASRAGYVAFVPDSLAREALAAGRITALAEIDSPDLGIYAVHLDGLRIERARDAVELLVAHARALATRPT